MEPDLRPKIEVRIDMRSLVEVLPGIKSSGIEHKLKITPSIHSFSG